MRIALTIQVFTDKWPDGTLVADWGSRAERPSISTAKNGFENLSFFVRMRDIESFKFYEMERALYIVVSAGSLVAWEGRIEDINIISGGIIVNAFGKWRAMRDTPYTGLWSDSGVADWRYGTQENLAFTTPKKFEQDNNNRLYITARQGETYTAGANYAYWYYLVPDQSETDIVEVTFTYDLTATNQFRAQLVSGTAVFGVGSLNVEWTLTGNGATQTATTTITLAAARPMIFFNFYAISTVAYASQTETDYIKITDIRVKASGSAAIYADEILDSIVSYVNGINAGQISTDTSLIESPAFDLEDELYEDRFPADIANHLASFGDGGSPPQKYEVGIYEGGRVFFRPEGSAAVDWYTDVLELELGGSIQNLANEQYAVYKDPNGRQLRTSIASDAISIARYGITRRSFSRARTVSSTTADGVRDANLEEFGYLTPRMSIKMSGLYNAAGQSFPLWVARAGDRLTLRNLPPTLSAEIDNIRTFLIKRTDYDPIGNVLSPVPGEVMPDVRFLISDGRVDERIHDDSIPVVGGPGGRPL